MSGLRKCAECDDLFKIDDDGPEWAPGGVAQRRVCGRCRHIKNILLALANLPKARTSFVKTGMGPMGHVIVPREGQEALVLTVRYKGDQMAAGVCEEHSGKIVHAEITFEPTHVDALEPLIGVMP